MIIQFALQDFIIFLLCALGITVAIIMIPVLLNIKKVTGILRGILVKNQESIQKSIKSLPGILENIGHVSQNSKEITNQLRISVPVIAYEVEGVSRAAKDGIEAAGEVLEKVGSGISSTVASYMDISENDTEDATGFMAFVPLINEVLQVINNTLLSKK